MKQVINGRCSWPSQKSAPKTQAQRKRLEDKHVRAQQLRDELEKPLADKKGLRAFEIVKMP
jgi:hypothetical protein